MKPKSKPRLYFKYSLEWWFIECDEIWQLIENKFHYNKSYKSQK